MEFKAGDRVHVTKLDCIEVDFYGTLVDAGGGIWKLVDCSDSEYENEEILKNDETGFGVNLDDYYTLATDEEDTEGPVIQRTTDNVNHPSHYNYGDIEVIDYCDQVCKQYPSDLAPYVFNAIKYLSRSEYKNGKEDVAKAKFYIQRLFDKWDDSHE